MHRKQHTKQHGGNEMPEAITDTPRILNTLSMSTSINNIGGVYTFTGLKADNGWEIIPANNSTDFVARWRGYIDLGGLEREALTFFLQAAQVVNNQGYKALTFGLTGADVMDVISKVEITDNDINHLMYDETEIYSPGFGDSLQDMDQVLWARYQEYYHDAGWTAADMLQISNQSIWGEGIGTSASRLHVTRIVSLPEETVEFEVPQGCWQVVGTAVEEPDLNYIMRLRRDYELAQQG